MDYVINPSAGPKAKKQLKSLANVGADMHYRANKIDSPYSNQILSTIEELQTLIARARAHAEGIEPYVTISVSR